MPSPCYLVYYKGPFSTIRYVLDISHDKALCIKYKKYFANECIYHVVVDTKDFRRYVNTWTFGFPKEVTWP